MKPKRGEVITLKDGLWLKRQKCAGRVVVKVHREFYAMMRGRSAHLSLSKMGDMASEIIRKNDCTPTFLNYRGFPSTICTSLNKELVHGFATRDIELQDGDVLKVDIGTTFEGAIADCAVTYIYGNAKNDRILKMLVSCQNALYDAIKVFEPGRRLGEVSSAIWQRGKKDGFGVVTEFGGHGLDYDKLHAAPFVANKSKITDGVIIQPGMSIAIEPMFVLGKNSNTKILNDRWTVVTHDIGCHYEHSVTLDNDGHQHIMTDHGICAKDFV